MDRNELIFLIDEAFEPYEKPVPERILTMSSDAIDYDFILSDMCALNDKNINGESIRFVGRCFSVLSKEMVRWIMPFYLKTCLSEEAEYTRLETTNLILTLTPSVERRPKLIFQLSLLNKEQMLCILRFLEWRRSGEYWQIFWLSEIEEAIDFVKSLC